MLREYLKRNWLRVLVSLLLLAVFIVHVANWHEWQLINRFDNIAYDARLLFTMPRTRDDRVVIIEIDEKSLVAEGRWPWSRDTVARLLEQLVDRYGVALVAFDVVFAEPEEPSALQVLDEIENLGGSTVSALGPKLEALRTRFDRDNVLAETIRSRDVILGVFFSASDDSENAQRIGQLPRPLFRRGQFAGRNIPFVQATGYSANLPELQQAARTAGHLQSVPDADGLVRRVPMLFEYDNDYYESISLAVARTLLGVPSVTPGFPAESRVGRSYSDLEWLGVGDRQIPVDAGVNALIPYRGPQGSFPYVSATDVIHGKADEKLLKGRVALVGATAKGLLDLRATPVQADYPGVEIHANLITGILDGSIKESPAYTVGAEFLLVLFCGLLMALLLPVLSPVWAGAMTLALLGGIVSVNLFVWQYGDFVFPIAASVLTVLTLFLFNMWYAYFFEARGKRQLTGLFGEYVPPELVEEMSENPNSFTLENQNRELTVLFSDIRDFTSISEGLSPDELSELMIEYLTAMTRVIHEHRGTIDKYMGDAIMAFWGAPVHDQDHARNAILAATQMITELRALRPQFRERNWPELRMGVGINTGDMNVGNMGSRYRRAYTVMGDAVNLGSRLEGLTKSYGVSIIVSRSTRDAAPEFAYRELDRVRVKGKEEPVTIYELVGHREAVNDTLREELKLYREALKLYRAKKWDMAELHFVKLQQRSPNRALYQVYTRRINHFQRYPPPRDWDGVFTHLDK